MLRTPNLLQSPQPACRERPYPTSLSLLRWSGSLRHAIAPGSAHDSHANPCAWPCTCSRDATAHPPATPGLLPRATMPADKPASTHVIARDLTYQPTPSSCSPLLVLHHLDVLSTRHLQQLHQWTHKASDTPFRPLPHANRAE